MERSYPLRRLYSTSLSMVAAVVLSPYLFFFQNPTSDIDTAVTSEFVDCYGMRPVTMTAKHSLVDVSVSVRKFVEFPSDIDNDFTDFLNMTVDGSNISFFSHDHIGVPTTTTLYCRDHLLAEISHIPEIGSEFCPGHSLAVPTPFRIA
jgi:hypothetical protein